MNLGERMLASLATRTVLRKRPRPDESPASSSRGDDTPRRAPKRARIDPEPGLPPGLGLGLGDEPPSAAGEEDRADAAAAAGASADEDFAPLDVAGRRAMASYIDRLMAEEESEHTCFFCDMVRRYDGELRRTGGQKDFMTEGAYGYKLAIDFVNEHPHFSCVKKARGVTHIYQVHVYGPAMRALGGRKPLHLPEPSVRDIVEHLLIYNYDQVALTMEQLQTARALVQTFNSQLMVENRANALNARTIVMANQQFAMLTDKMAKLRDARGIPEGPFMLDPQKVMAFSDTRPIDAFRKQAEGQGIGGATATNTAEEAERVTAQRPAFGHMAAARDDDDDAYAGEEEEEGSREEP
jgi:hypothetical protein